MDFGNATTKSAPAKNRSVHQIHSNAGCARQPACFCFSFLVAEGSETVRRAEASRAVVAALRVAVIADCASAVAAARHVVEVRRVRIDRRGRVDAAVTKREQARNEGRSLARSAPDTPTGWRAADGTVDGNTGV